MGSHLISFRGNTYNPGQNIWNKTEKSNKTGQEKKGSYTKFPILDITFCFTCG